MIAVTMHTPSYRIKAERLSASAERTGVVLKVYPVEPAVNWRRTTHAKATVIQQAMTQHKNEDVLWVDADSEFMEYPIAVHRMPADAVVAAFNHGGFLWGSTIWFRACLQARLLVRRWVEQNQATPQYSADNNLWYCIGQNHKHYVKLPFSYCACEHPEMWGLKEVDSPVIIHYGSFSGQEKYSGIRHPLVKE